MFSIFKSKPILSSFIKEGQIDIHSHLLFGLDDGAKTVEDSLLLADKFLSAGYTHCIVTPHIMNTVYDNTAEGISDRCETLKTEFEKHQIPLKIKAAAEYQMDTGFLPLAKEKKLLTLRDNWVLVEMSYLNPPINLFDILFELQLAGYQPVLAHPERYTFYGSNLEEYEKLKNAGCKFQMNLLSAMGYYGPNATKTIDMLLGQNLIDFVGSDWHHLNHSKSIQKEVRIKNTKALERALENTEIFKF